MRPADSIIQTSYYEQADGPLVFMRAYRPEALRWLLARILPLARGKADVVHLHSLDAMRLVGFDRFELVRGPDELSAFRLDHAVVSKTEGVAVIWKEPAYVWTDVCGLIKSLSRADHPGHQYLAAGTPTGVEIVLEFAPESA